MAYQSWQTPFYGAQPFHPAQEPLSYLPSTVSGTHGYSSASDVYGGSMMPSNGSLETYRGDNRMKRSYSSFSGSVDNSSSKSAYSERKKLSTEERRKMLSCKLRFMAPNVDFWASLKNGLKFWQNENPKTLLVSLYGRQGCAAPLFMWYDQHNGVDYPMEDKIPKEYATELISRGRLFFEITYSQLSTPYASTNLRVQATDSCTATRHVACVMAIAEILLLPDVTPSTYTQQHLYSEIRLLFSVPKEFVNQVLSDINALERNDSFFVNRFDLLKELASTFKIFTNHTSIYDPTFSSKIVSPLPKKATPRTIVIQQSQKPILSVVIPPDFVPKLSLTTKTGNQQGVTHPIEEEGRPRLVRSEIQENRENKYVVDTIHRCDALKMTEDEIGFYKLSFDFTIPIKLQELVGGLLNDIMNAVDDEERPANALYILWNAKKAEVTKILLSGASSEVFTLICTKIEFKCSTARILLQMVDLFTQLLALHETPNLIVEKIISKEFIAHLYTLIQWTGSFKEVNEFSQAATTILSKALLLLHELSPGLPSLIVADSRTCLLSISAIQKISGCSFSTELSNLLSSWARPKSSRVHFRVRKSTEHTNSSC